MWERMYWACFGFSQGYLVAWLTPNLVAWLAPKITAAQLRRRERKKSAKVGSSRPE